MSKGGWARGRESAAKPIGTVAVNLDLELSQAFWSWMQGEGYTNRAEAARALLRIALAATPSIGAEHAARIRAWGETRNWLMARVSTALAEWKVAIDATREGAPTEGDGGDRL